MALFEPTRKAFVHQGSLVVIRKKLPKVRNIPLNSNVIYCDLQLNLAGGLVHAATVADASHHVNRLNFVDFGKGDLSSEGSSAQSDNQACHHNQFVGHLGKKIVGY